MAPMMDWTDKHCRAFHRILSQQALLYTEMVTTGALIHGDSQRYLAYNEQEHPVALQLGGSNPKELAHCAKLAEAYGYDEVNLNVGCPSDRVQNNMMGACLMAHPLLVKDCLNAMQDAVSTPVTIKHRLGIDNLDSDALLEDFVGITSESGCRTYIVHARKAILQGLSPKENRDIPPLQYERVHRLKQCFPHLEIIINGGIKTLTHCQEHLETLDGVMIGREAYHNPYLLADVDRQLYGQIKAPVSRIDALLAYLPYMQSQLDTGIPLHHMSRHLLGLFHGVRGGKQFRRIISESAHKPDADTGLILKALEPVQPSH